MKTRDTIVAHSKAILTVLVTVTAFAAHAVDSNWEDNRDTSWGATLSDPMPIGTAEELAQFAWLVNQGNNFAGKTVLLTKDVDLSGRQWTPAGWESTTVVGINKFSGTFDGQGYTISGVTIHVSNTVWCAGLFGYINVGGIVRNINLVDTDIVVFHDGYGLPGVFAGGVSGYNYGGTIENCQNNGSVSIFSTIGMPVCGGIVSINDGNNTSIIGRVINCRNNGAVTSPNSGRCFVGGLMGINRGVVADSSNRGPVTAACAGSPFGFETACGGVSGQNQGTIKNSSNSGDVTFSCASASPAACAGVAGQNTYNFNNPSTYGTIVNCSNSGNVSLSSPNAACGGVVGQNQYGSLANCMSSGGVNISSPSCGGVAGANNDMLGDSYWKKDGTAGFNLNAVGSGSGDATLIPFGAAPGTFAAPHPTYVTTSLLDALNGWVDAANTAQGEDLYLRWTLDGSPDGYPVLDQSVPAVTPPSDYWSDEQNRDTSWGATLSDPMYIGTAEELAQFAWLVNQGNNFAGKTVLLTKDVDLSRHQWTPVGADQYMFSGTFDGQGHTISGMTIHASNTVTHVGLFGFIGEGSIVRNVNLVGTDITVFSNIDNIRVGGVVGVSNYGTIENCHNSGSVSACILLPWDYAHCGGIVGVNTGGLVKDCSNSSAVFASGSSSATVGGIVGLSGDTNGTVANCRNSGVISSTTLSYSHCGGVAGWNRSLVVNCWSIGNVTIPASSIAYGGGVIGENGWPTGCALQNNYWLASNITKPIGISYWSSATSNLLPFGAAPGAFTSPHPTYVTTSLLDALNVWVDAQGAGDYRHWTLDGSPDGYPVLDQSVPAVTPPSDYWSDEQNRDTSWGATLSDPMHIGTAGELAQFAWLVNQGNDFAGKTILLTKSIDLSGRQWTPAGCTSTTVTDTNKFLGTFDAQEHPIYGMTIHASNTVWCAGLFGCINFGSVVRNVTLVDTDIVLFHDGYGLPGIFAGGVSGYNSGGTIENCQNNGSVSAFSTIGMPVCGGIVSVNDGNTTSFIGRVINCRNNGAVISPSSGRCFLGGLIGINRGVVADSSNRGPVTAACAGSPFGFETACGGVSGQNQGTIKNSSNSGDVTFSCASASPAACAGVAGQNTYNFYNSSTYGTIVNCSNSGNVSLSSPNAACGGVVGQNQYGSLANCMSSGGVNISSPSCGGVAGANNDMLGDSYWKKDGTAGFNLNAVGSGSGDATLIPFGAAPGTFAAPHPTYATTSLLDALNGWVDAANTALGEDLYLRWTLDGSPDGYPVLDQSVPAVTPPSDYWSDEQNRDTSWGATLSDPMHIGTAEELAQFAWLVNQGNNFAGKTVLLTKDVDLSRHQWTPVGADQYMFSGTFDGQGYTISGVTIHATNTVTFAGLFGYITTGSVVRNVTLVDTDINVFHGASGIFVGSVSGYNYGGTIENCQNNGTMNASSWNAVYCGGIVALNHGNNTSIIATVRNCRNSGEVLSINPPSLATRCYIGGITAINRGVVADCSNSARVTAECAGMPIGQSTTCGGLAGDNQGAILNSANSGDVTFACASVSDAYCGGVAGRTFNNCDNLSAYGLIANSWNSGNVSLSSPNGYCGGVVGRITYGTVEESYWLASGAAQAFANASAIGVHHNLLSFGTPPGAFATAHPTYATTSLLDALNGWVDAANTAQGEDIYLRWTLEGSPDGYPVLDQSVPAVTPPSDYWSDEQNRDTSWGATLSDPMPIGTAEELAQFAWLVNQGNNFAGKTILLTKDVDLSGHQWTPAGTDQYVFSGTFDGQGYTIYGVTIHASNTVTHVGLFGFTGEGSIVRNVNLVGTDITVFSNIDNIRVGGVVGISNRGTIENCHNSGSVSACILLPWDYAHCGGIVGVNTGGLVKDCSNSSAVFASGSSSATVGGIVGLSGDTNGTVANCRNSGAISSTTLSYSHCGGVAGWNRSLVMNCWSIGNVTIPASSIAYGGGVIGENGWPTGCVVQNNYWLVSNTTKPIGLFSWFSTLGTLLPFGAAPGAFTSPHPTYATTSLLDALNGWVDAQGAGDYRHWTLEGSPDGYPVLCSEVQPPAPSTFTVEFISTALNGSGTMEPQTFTNGVAQNLTLNAFTYPCTAFATPVNFPFLGWGTNATYTLPMFTDGESLNLTGAPDITLYTAWGAVTDDDTGFIANPDGSVITDDGSVSPDGSMTVTLDPAGGDFGVTSVVCTGYTYNGLPTDGTRSGFTFTGWETTTGIPVVNGMPFHQARFAATLIAQWVLATEPDISDIVAPTPTVGVTYRGQVIMGMHAVPSTLSAKQLPSGLKLNSSSGEITGVPKKEGIYTVTVRATSLANRKVYTERVFRMVVAPLPARAIGTFDGYLDGEDTHGAVNLGNVTLTASASGKVSAKVVAAGHGTQSISIPAWDSLSNGVLRATAVSAKGVPLAIGLDTTAEFGTWQITGVFGGIPALAQRSPLKVKADPDFAIAQEALAAYMGYYTIGIRGDTVLEQGPSGTIPEGLGYLSTTVGTKPTLKFAGRLADGTAISGAYPIVFGEDSAFVPYFTPLYKTEGYHSGLLEIDPLLTVTGEGRWTYPGASPTAKAPLTADRFTLGLLLSGGPYTPTAATLEAYSQGGPLLMFGAPEAGYTYTKGKYSVTAGPLGLPSELSLIGDKKGLLTLPPDNPALATFKVTPSTGVFKGKLTVYYEYPDEGGVLRLKGVSASYQGILTPLGDFGAGAGYYLLDDAWQDTSGAKPVTYKIKRSAFVSVEE